MLDSCSIDGRSLHTATSVRSPSTETTERADIISLALPEQPAARVIASDRVKLLKCEREATNLLINSLRIDKRRKDRLRLYNTKEFQGQRHGEADEDVEELYSQLEAI